MQAIANIGWLCGRCGFAMFVASIEAAQFREMSCGNKDCGHYAIRYKEPQIAVDLQLVEPELAVHNE